MPPRQKKVEPFTAQNNDMHVQNAVLMINPEEPMLDPNPYRILPGAFVHVVTRGGAKYKSAEVLSVVDGLTLRTSLLGPTQAEITFVPWSAIDGVGLIGVR